MSIWGIEPVLSLRDPDNPDQVALRSPLFKHIDPDQAQESIPEVVSCAKTCKVHTDELDVTLSPGADLSSVISQLLELGRESYLQGGFRMSDALKFVVLLVLAGVLMYSLLL